ncbi:MAG: histidine phosphatase family protein [Phycisphaerales bacterium]|jgi:phosphohistidine phosphatase|nr:histidine phosphatase family protein [Phycisphaerales bacterium]
MNAHAPLSRLIILRHGKAEKHSPSGTDVDRALRPRGVRQAQHIGQMLIERAPQWLPTLIVSSPLVRARQTAEALQAALGTPGSKRCVSIEIDDRLSTRCSEREHLQAASSRLAGGHATLVLVGHNPTLSSLVADLLVRDAKQPGELSTGQAAVLHWPARLDASRFSAIPPHSARLEALLRLEEPDDD